MERCGGAGKKVDSGFDVRLLVWGWPQLEADFLRDYGIDLTRAVWEEGMTMHRFTVLVSGLTSQSAWAEFINDEDRYLAASFY